MELREESIEYLKATSFKYLKSNGQFFTKKSLREELFKLLPKIDKPLILEPACGTGEFSKDFSLFFNEPIVTKIEKDTSLAKISSSINEDFLLFKETNKYDYVITNPPYFEVKKTKFLEDNFKEVINGRINIYSLFFKKSIEALKNGGILAFIVPTSMNSGAYFSKLRKYIVNNTKIIEMRIFNDTNMFYEAEQKVMIIVLRKGEKDDGKFVFEKNGQIYFTKNKEYVNSLFENTISLKEAGFSVKTGSIVWNKNKHLLTNNNENRLLVWSKNISRKNYINPRGQYIKLKETEVYPSLVINRIIGNPNKPAIKVVLINTPFLAENHVNIITRNKEAKCSFEHLIKNINSERTKEIIKNLIGNTQLSKTELENVIPIENISTQNSIYKNK